MGALSRNKGNEAERHVIKLLQPLIDDAYATMHREGYVVPHVPQLQRNTLQSDKGGCDLAGLRWAAVEIKHHAVLALPAWWAQCVNQAKALQGEPILIYRRTGGPWHVRLMCQLIIGAEYSYPCYADVGWVEFAQWFKRRCMYEAHVDIQRSKIV